MKISHYTGGMAMTNGWLVQTDAGCIVVDAPEGMAQWLRQRGVKVNALLLTHQHFDHVLDVARIQLEHAPETFAFAPFSQELTLELLMETATGVKVIVPPFKVDRLLEGGTDFQCAGVNWHVEHIPGHSPDSIIFYAAEEGVLLSGDVLFAGSIGRTDFPGGSMETLLDGIAHHILPLPDSTLVLPGHGPETQVGTERSKNPYLN